MDKKPPNFTGTQSRAFRSAEISKINVESRTVELCFSSEAEVERCFGFEVLSHAPGAVVLTRLQDGAPLLLNHEAEDQIGVVESVSIDADRRGRAVVRFGKSELAEEIFQDVQDGIRRHVSVGYLIHEAKLTEERSDSDVYTVTQWEPFEISIVPVPADPTVGVGRSLEPQLPNSSIEPEKGTLTMSETTQATSAPMIDVNIERQKATAQERERVRSISEIGEKFGAADLAKDAVRDGMTVADFQAAVLNQLNSRKQQPLTEKLSEREIGLTNKEVRQFSLLKVIRALDSRSKEDMEAAAFEFEAGRAAAQAAGKRGNNFVIPNDILTRAFNTGVDGMAPGNTGGNSIATNLMAGSFIDILRNQTTIMQLGSIMTGLTGNIEIPRQTEASQGYWLDEDQDATETGLKLDQIQMSPKTVAAYSEISRKLLLQSSLDVEALVRNDLSRALALTIDKAGYYGSGSNHEPLGLANQTGINAQAFAAMQPTFAELVAMQTSISKGNAATAGMAYVSSPEFEGHAKTTLKFQAAGSFTIWEPGSTVNGHRALITNQVTTGDVFMGNFADLLIGIWSGLELMVDPYSNSKSGRLRIVVFQDVDFAIRRPESFCLGRKA